MTALWLLAACGGPYDGSWLLAFVQRGGESSPSGDREDALVSLYTTSSGSTVVEVEGMTMTGTTEGGNLDVVAYAYQTYKDGSCELRYESTYSLAGTFAGTAEVAGTLKLTDARVYEGCGDDNERTDIRTYDMTGLRLEPGTHARDLEYSWFDSYGYDYEYDYEYDYGDDVGDTG